jgi:hypothetical protein
LVKHRLATIASLFAGAGSKADVAVTTTARGPQWLGENPSWLVVAYRISWNTALAVEEAALNHSGREIRADERREQARLLRDIFGPGSFLPLPTINLSWLSWNGGTVKHLAEAAYGERHLPSGHLDRGRLAVLADALTDAGCQDAELLEHLRGPGPHVRGCWAVDLLLAKM